MADHNIRVILDAVDKGSANVRRFFSNADREVGKFRKSLQGLKKEQEEIFLFGGGRGTRGPGGRFEKERSNIEKATIALRKFKKEIRESFVGQGLGGLTSGLSEEREIRRRFDERKKLSKKALADEKQAERDALEERLRDIRSFYDKKQREAEVTDIIEIKSRHNALAKMKADEANFLEDVIRAERRAAIQRGEAFQAPTGLRERINELRKEEDQIKANRDAEIDAVKKRIRLEEDFQKTQARRESRTALGAIVPEDDVTLLRNIRNEVRGLGDDVDKNDSKIRRFGANSGRAFGQFRSGIRLARNGLNDTEKELLKSSSAAERLGARLGNAVRPAGAFRARILLLIGVLQILGTLVVQLGAALVALASSAILAAGALGGALLAGVTQLLPVVGLLAAAFARLGAVLDAAKIADKLELTRAEDQKTRLDGIRQAAQRLADARFNLQKAGEGVKDAEYDLAQAHIAVRDAIAEQREAVENLAQARKQAARDIVDANFEEKEAALALAEAEIAVRDAKRALREEEQNATLNQQNIEDAQAQVKEAQARLAQARAEGDQNEVAVALQQLSVAEQDLQQIQAQAQESKDTIKQAKIDVQQAQLQHQEAIVRNKRAQEDASKARKDGIEGADRVVSAQKQLVQATRNVAQAERQVALSQRGIRDAIHSLTVAKREEKDAEDALSDSRKKATAQQEQLQNALGDLSPAEKRLFRSIQRIKDIYKKNFRPITDIIISAFADAIDTIAPLLADPKILAGARNLANAIAESVDKLANFAVSPEFKRFIVFTLDQGAKNVPKITDGIIALGKVLIRVARAATPVFNNLLDRFVAFLQKLEEGTRNPEGLNRFFGTAARHLDSWIKFFGAVGRVLGLVIKFSAPAGKGILDDLTAKLDEWADWLNDHGKEVREFFRNVRVQVGALGTALGKMAVILFKAFSSKEASDLSILLLNTIIPAFAIFLKMLGVVARILNFIFSIPLIGPLTQQIIKFGLALLIATKFAATLAGPIGRLISLFKALWLVLTGARVAAVAGAALNALAIAIKGVGIALRFVFITNPWIAVIAGIIAAIVLLDRKFHFIRPTIEAIGKAFRFVFEWIKKHWKLLLAIVLGPFGLIIIGIIKWRDKILDTIKSIINWVRDHWKLLIVAALLAPFALTGAIIFGIIKFRERLLELIRAIPGLLKKAIEKIPDIFKAIFDKIPGLLKDALKGLGGIVTSAIEKIPGGKRLLGFFGVGKSEEEKFEDFLKDPILDSQDRKKAKRLKEQGMELSKIIVRLARDQGITPEEAKKLVGKYVFHKGGTVPGSSGAVPIIAHAGEWVLNAAQQAKLTSRLGESAEQTKMWLFGTNKGQGKPGPKTTGTRPTSKEKIRTFRNFNLVPQQDPDGQIVWFIEMDDGAFGQVSSRDARKIIATDGTFIPGYVKRSTHGFSNPLFRVRERNKEIAQHKLLGGVVQAFYRGGVVQNWAGPALQSFSEGGTVLQNSSFGAPSPTTTKSVEQNFNVTTQNETDWNYVLRLGALHANSAYT